MPDITKSLIDLTPEARVEQIFKDMERVAAVYDNQINLLTENKDFYTGVNNSQWRGVSPEGDLMLTIPVTSAILQQYQALLTNVPPKFSLVMEDAEPISRLRAEVGEDLTEKVLNDAFFPKLFKMMGSHYYMLGRLYLQLWFDR